MDESLPRMRLTGGLRRKARRKKSRGTATPREAGGKSRHADAAKAAVMAYVELLIQHGLAQRSKADNGAIELRLSTGEVFNFGEASVTRTM